MSFSLFPDTVKNATHPARIVGMTTLSLLCLQTPGRAQTEFQQITASYQPISGYLAGNGIVTASTVPESSEWNPENEGSSASAINLGNPHIAMADAWGNIYIAEKSNHSILKITPDGLAHTFAGTHEYPYTGPAPSYSPPAGFTSDIPGPATSINLVACNGLYVLPNGIVYIYDAGNHRIRRVGLDGVMTTIVNDPDPKWLPSGRGLWVSPAEDLIYYTQEVADLNTPIPVDSINHPPLGGVVKKWTPAGGIQAITAYPATPTAANLELINPGNIDVHPVTHKLYVTDRAEADLTLTKSCVYRIDTESPNPLTTPSTKTRTAGTYNIPSVTPADGAPAASTWLNQVRGISFTPDGGYFLCTHKGGQVWYVDTDPVTPRIHLFLQGRGKNDIKFTPSTPLALPVTTVECHSQPRAVSVAPDGSLLIVSNDSGVVRKIKNAVLPHLPPIDLVERTFPATLHLAWTAPPGHSYIIQRSNSLAPGSWQDDTVISPTAPVAHFSEAIAPGADSAFYRLAAPR
jgi:hypothetical protein